MIDAEARRRSTRDFSGDRVVLASAGTGKTSLLVDRAVFALVGEGIAPSALAAITFTEKAAAEMRDRLGDLLEGMAGGGPEADGAVVRCLEGLAETRGMDAAAVARRCRAVLEDLDRMTIATIHGFCAELLRNHPIEAGIDPLFRIDDGGEGARLAEERWGEWLADELGPEGKRHSLWRKLFDRIPFERIEPLALAWAEAGGEASDEESARAALQESCTERAAVLRRFRADAEGLTDRLESYLDAAADELERIGREGIDSPGPDPEDLYDGKTLPKPGKKTAGVDAVALDEAVKGADRLLRGVREIDAPLCARVEELLRPFFDRLAGIRRDAGLVSFHELLRFARDLLEIPAVAEAERAGLAGILLDEFQDTDPLQYEIFRILGRGSTKDAEAPWTFVVGDPKQSIYRFRGADLEATEGALDRMRRHGAAREELRTNFRSRPAILGTVNRMFEGLFEQRSGVQPAYAPVDPHLDGEEGAGVSIVSLEPPEGGGNVDRLREREGVWIADWIARRVAEGSLRYRDAAILFARTGGAEHYLRALRERGIPFVVEGGKELLNREEIRYLTALLFALGDPADVTALLAVSRSPLCGADDVELARYASAGGGWDLARARPDPEGCPNLARTFERMRRLRARMADLAVDEGIREAVRETRLAELLAVHHEGGQRLANLAAAVDRIAGIARDAGVDAAEAARTYAEEVERQPDRAVPVADEASDAVRVLTVHRAKGLEFPVVILPDLMHGKGSDRDEVVVRALAIGGKGTVALRFKAGGDRVRNAADLCASLRDRDHEAAEDVRLFYVACTRAKRELVFVASPKSPNEGACWKRHLDRAAGYLYEEAPPEEDSFLDGGIAHRVEAVPKREGGRDGIVPDVTALVEAHRRFESARAKGQASGERRWLATPSSLDRDRVARADPEADSAPPGVAAARDVAAAAGSVVHAMLVAWDRKDAGWFRKAAPGFVAAAAPADPEGTAREVGAVLDAFLGSDLPVRLASLDLVGREVPFEDGGGDPGEPHIHGSIDLLYAEEGRIVVADFKTDRVAAGKEPKLLDRYAAQLEAYAAAVRRALALPEPPAVELWTLRTGRVIRRNRTGTAEG